MIVGRNDSCPCGKGKKFKKCHLGKVAPLVSESFTISIKDDKVVYKVFRIHFHRNSKGEASIIVSLPYFEKTKGLLSKITFPANTRKINNLSMKIGGKTTSNTVKFSHWMDGNTHFSQDGKILTTIRNLSNPLNVDIGHLFTVQIQGLKGFKLKTDAKKKTSKEIDLDVSLEEEIKSIKFIAWWYDSSVVHENSGKHFGNPYYFKRADGKVERAFALQSPQDYPISNKILLLSISAMPFLSKEKGSRLLFIGGYDPKKIFNDITKDFHFLTALYPARNYRKLLKEIGSIDLSKNIIN